MGNTELPSGLYETLVSRAVAGLLESRDPKLVMRDRLLASEAADRIALHVARLLEGALRDIADDERVVQGVAIVDAIVHSVAQLTAQQELQQESLVDGGVVLRSITSAQPDGTPRPIEQPLIPLLDTTLLTNAKGEPSVGNQIVAEIDSAYQIDAVIAFIRKTGIAPMLTSLRRHVEGGGRLRILTTTYTGSTQAAALDQLVALGAEVKVSYDTTSTRLHAKAWLFHRPSGFSTAYIGSSNLSGQAQQTGLEWNVRASGARNPAVIEKMNAVFESYWESPDFVPYDRDHFLTMVAATNATPAVLIGPVAVTPLPFQQRLLELLAVARAAGRHRNLLVSATGTGKTVMSALDYATLSAHLPRARLLFVAHRREILDQSLATFRQVLRDPTFGELWVGGQRPKQFDHVFASVQSLHNTSLDDLDPNHFDVVIIDEFHHAAADSYERLLQHLAPVELLGLTATPERADGMALLHWFDDRIAAELRLWDAIDQGYLAPFTYFGIFDGLDLTDIPWKRGTGYDVEGLTNLITANDLWAQFVVKQLADHCDDLGSMRALGFCVSIDHARYMARVFNEAGIAAEAIWSNTPAEDRRHSLQRLAAGTTKVIFSVDLFNEGVDLPTVDTLLFLRPTESGTLFLQQLGRGLRKHPRKTSCLVLDFVGQHRREFRFDLKLRALLGGSRKDLEAQVSKDFPFLPAGCAMHLDEMARNVVLANIKAAIPTKNTQRADELRAMVSAGHAPTMQNYLHHSGLEVEDLYSGGSGWSDLCERAGVEVAAQGPQEATLRKAIGRLLHTDDAERLDFLHRIVAHTTWVNSEMTLRESRLLRMLTSQMFDQVPEMALRRDASLDDALELLRHHPQVIAELEQLHSVLRSRIDHVHHSLPDRPDVPLQIHAQYTRREILAAFGHGSGARTALWQSGVFWLPAASADLFAITLDKSSGNFSPTTRYHDYAISRDLFHWESQSTTAADSATGQRYQQHVQRGSDVYLFTRLRADTRAFRFLGPATYVRHSGERPMAITWKLRFALPGDVFSDFAVA